MVPFAARGPLQPVAQDARGDGAVFAERGAISADFFSALGVSMRAGRAFADREPSAMRTAIVNEALAGRLFADRSPVGARVWIGSTAYDIVGVVSNYSNNPLQPPESAPRIFMPLPPESADQRRLYFIIRAAGDPAALVQTVRREVRDAAIGNVVISGTVDQTIRVASQEIMIGTAPLFPLISIGMLLTMAGIYGVLAFAVTRRARELAVRVALGATGQDLVRLITTHTLRLVAVGAGLGVGLTFVLSRLLRAAGGAGSIFDPAVTAFVVPVLVVAAIGIVATWIPARRASAIDPVALLRSM